MIGVVKPNPPAVLLRRGETERLLLCAAFEAAPADYHSGRTKFEFKATVYAAREVKTALRQAQHQKCAFCESAFTHIGYGDVEHFRPKGGYRQAATGRLRRPGYYWLAYEWANLFFSCQLCNEQFKKNLFPLRNNRHRARSHLHDLAKEHPLLIDPGRLDPAGHIGFREEMAFAVDGSPEGLATIEGLGLNRPDLVHYRRKRLTDLRILLRALHLQRDLVARHPTTEHRLQLADLARELEDRQAVANEYCSMVRAYVNRVLN
jgi:uncharacterized protein (TIGR02646 family)